jgi:MFS family permease
VTTHKTIWTFVITSVALFMVTLDNLVVTTALPVIREDLGASLEQLEWTVNAYTLTFAVLLLTGAALGDRFGRRLMFSIGIGIFTLASPPRRSRRPRRRSTSPRACRASAARSSRR